MNEHASITEEHEEKFSLHRLWHGWHTVHQIIAVYALKEFIWKLWDNHSEIILTLHNLGTELSRLMELMS